MKLKILAVLLAGLAPALLAQQPAPASDDHQLVLQLLQRVNELEAEVRQLKGVQPVSLVPVSLAATQTAQTPQSATLSTPPSAPAGGMPGMALPDVMGLQFRGFADNLFTASNQKGTHSTFSEDAGFDFFMTSRMSDQFSALAEM